MCDVRAFSERDNTRDTKDTKKARIGSRVLSESADKKSRENDHVTDADVGGQEQRSTRLRQAPPCRDRVNTKRQAASHDDFERHAHRAAIRSPSRGPWFRWKLDDGQRNVCAEGEQSRQTSRSTSFQRVF